MRITSSIENIQCGDITSIYVYQRRAVSAGEMMGRQTGSLAWRQQRGELGTQMDSEGHIFFPTAAETDQNKMVVKYCCASNKYTQGDILLHDWASGTDTGYSQSFLCVCVFIYPVIQLILISPGIYKCQDVIRNVEVDWNMVYLARRRGTDSAFISWRFDVTSTGDLSVNKYTTS